MQYYFLKLRGKLGIFLCLSALALVGMIIGIRTFAANQTVDYSYNPMTMISDSTSKTYTNKTYNSTTNSRNAVLVNSASAGNVDTQVTTFNAPIIKMTGGNSLTFVNVSDATVYPPFEIQDNSAALMVRDTKVKVLGGTITSTGAAAPGVVASAKTIKNVIEKSVDMPTVGSVKTEYAMGDYDDSTNYACKLTMDNTTVTASGDKTVAIMLKACEESSIDYSNPPTGLMGKIAAVQAQGVYSTALYLIDSALDVKNMEVLTNSVWGSYVVQTEGTSYLNATNVDFTATNPYVFNIAGGTSVYLYDSSVSGRRTDCTVPTGGSSDACGQANMVLSNGSSLYMQGGSVSRTANFEMDDANVSLMNTTATNLNFDIKTSSGSSENEILLNGMEAKANITRACNTNLLWEMYDNAAITGGVTNNCSGTDTGGVKVMMDATSAWSLTSDTYLTELQNDDTTNSNISSANGAKLYVNGTEVPISGSDTKTTLTITSATVKPWKYYDGTDMAEVTNVVLSDTSLVFGTDYTAYASYDSVDVGTNIGVTVTVNLSAATALNYTLPTNTYRTTADIRERPTYTITTRSSAADGCSGTVQVLGDTSVTYGDSRTIKFTASGTGCKLTQALVNGTDMTSNVSSAGLLSLSSITSDLLIIGYFSTNDPAATYTYELTFDANTTDIVSYLPADMTYGPTTDTQHSFVLTSSQMTPKRDGYTFKGWTKGGSTTSTIYTEGSTVILFKDAPRVTMSAVWEENPIEKTKISIANVSVANKTYNGNADATVNSVTFSSNTPSVCASDYSATGIFTDGANAGSGKSVLVTVTLGSTASQRCELTSNTFVTTASISKASSGVPPEVSADSSGVVGAPISSINLVTKGLSWVDPTTVITAGTNLYQALYVRNGDNINYTVDTVEIPITGKSASEITQHKVKISGINVKTTPDGEIMINDGNNLSIGFEPDYGYYVASVTINGADWTSSIEDNKIGIIGITTDMDVVVTGMQITHETTEGNGMTYTGHEGKNARFGFAVDYEKFKDGGRVFIDGGLLDERYYTVVPDGNGGMYIDISSEYMDTLGPGEHKLVVLFNDGSVAQADFMVEGTGIPDTGWFTGDVSVSGVGIVATIVAAVVLPIAGFVGWFVWRKAHKPALDKPDN